MLTDLREEVHEKVAESAEGAKHYVHVGLREAPFPDGRRRKTWGGERGRERWEEGRERKGRGGDMYKEGEKEKNEMVCVCMRNIDSLCVFVRCCLHKYRKTVQLRRPEAKRLGRGEKEQTADVRKPHGYSHYIVW